MKKFDLNIEKVLENWDVSHALRELIANAIDESIITKTEEPKIEKRQGKWIIRDYGRGLEYKHFTQNENEEKLKRKDEVIGKFGVGLKDALATLERNGIGVVIRTKNTEIRLERKSKEEFKDVITLHAIIKEVENEGLVGTEFELTGIEDKEVEKAKKYFLKYNQEEIVEKTKYGEVLRKKGGKSKIYINGIAIAEEENYLFSYNITSSTEKLRKAINRERTNVGRNAYTDRVKKILLTCESKGFAEELAEDFIRLEKGTNHDEMQLKEIQKHAIKILNETGEYVFFSAMQMQYNFKYVEYAKQKGKMIITVPDDLAQQINLWEDRDGNRISGLDTFIEDLNENFEYEFVEIDELSESEKEVYKMKDEIFDFMKVKEIKVRKLMISENMTTDMYGLEMNGLWDGKERRIVIKRKLLKNQEKFLAVLIHEIIHMKTNEDDLTIEFENALTNALGKFANEMIKRRDID